VVITLLSGQSPQTSFGLLRLNFIFTLIESCRSQGLCCCQGVFKFS